MTEEKNKEAQNNEQPAENQQEKTNAPVESKAETEVKAETEPAKTEEEKPQPEAAKPKAEEPVNPEAVTDWATPSDDFDWEDGGKTDEVYSKEEMEKLENVYDNTLSTVNENEVIDGTVVSFNKREVVVNIGYKSEAVVNATEFRYNPDLQPGDKVEVMVETLEDPDGQLILSHKKARTLRSWESVNSAFEHEEIIKGFIKCRTKGGMIVDVFGIEAFLPGSQIDVKPIRDYDQFVEKTMNFKVVKINQEYKNVVVSHKALIEAELEAQKKEIIAKLEKGQVLEGAVKNITSYGVFVDLGGVDGLIHITDLSWGRVQHPEEIVTLDEKIQVVILDFDNDKRRIALGLKQLTPHPWDSLDENLKVGDKVKGKVVVMADYGAFVEISSGVEGLIHVSEMSWSQHLRSAQEFMNVRDEVEAVILTLDREERKMSLGIKQLYPDPWADIEEKYLVGSHHKSKVRNFTNFGVFVELEEGVDGLIHISDLSWTKKIKHPAEFTQIGVEMEVVVLEVDKENRRLSLGHKQLEENPWDVFETIFSVGSIHEGTITDLNNKGAVISLPYGVEGFATPKHLVKEDGNPAKQDEKLNFKVVEFNKDARKIFVSHSRIHEDENRAQQDDKSKKSGKKQGGRNVNKISDKIEKTTFGDVSGLAELKQQMVNLEKAAKTPKKTEKAEVKETPKAEEEKGKDPKATAKKEDAKAEPKAKKEEAKADDKAEKKETPAKKAKAKKEDAKEDKAEAKEETPKSEEKPKAKSKAKEAAPKAKKAEGKAEEKAEEKTDDKKDDTADKA